MLPATKNPDHPALLKFSSEQTVSGLAGALTELLAAKALQKVVKTSEFRVGLHRLFQLATDAHDDCDRLEALAQLVRIAQSARAITSEVKRLILPLLDFPLPSVHLLKDPDSRGYVAKACGWSQAPWILAYAVQAIAEEDTAEKVRTEFAEVAFLRAASLGEIFSMLEGAMSELRLATETPADSMAIRIIRILGVLRGALVVSRLPPGDGVGDKLSSMVRVPLSVTGLTNKEGRALSLAREIILCTYELVRTRFSLSTDASTYEPLKTAKRILSGTAWPEELKVDLHLISDCILEALLLLAKQGLMSSSLVSNLELVGNKYRAEALLRDIADSHPELNENVRNWLRKANPIAGGTHREALSASSDLRLDPQLGQALIDAAQVSDDLDVIQANVITALRVYDPSQASILEQHTARTINLLLTIKEMASRRCLAIYGAAGTMIDYSPKYFEQVGAADGAKGRVLRPAIVRVDEDDRIGEVVIKGLIERH
jgi:hypothetical protein